MCKERNDKRVELESALDSAIDELASHMGTNGIEGVTHGGIKYSMGDSLQEIKELGIWLTGFTGIDDEKDLANSKYWIENRHRFEK